MMSSGFIFCLLITLAVGGIKVYNGKAWRCDEEKSTYYDLNNPKNCTKNYFVKEDGRYYCIDFGCENGGWQAVEKGSPTLICCRPQCDTYHCDGSILQDSSTPGIEGTRDFGKTWTVLTALFPKCPGGSIRICYNTDKEPCPLNVQVVKLYYYHLYCVSPTCSGKLVLDEIANVWRCEDKSCEDMKGRMYYSGEYDKWFCQTPKCTHMTYAPTQKKWLCDEKTSFCHQAKDYCGWNPSL